MTDKPRRARDDDTRAMQAAVDAAAALGGGAVLLPGRLLRFRGLQLRAGVVLVAVPEDCT